MSVRWLILMLLGAITTLPGKEAEGVVLLHGLARTSASMERLERALNEAGYSVINVDYPSRTAPIERLSDDAIGGALAACRSRGLGRIHFVTHSMGGSWCAVIWRGTKCRSWGAS